MGAPLPPPPQPPSKKKLSEEMVTKIREYCEEESWPCPNRTVRNGQGVRYWRKPIQVIHAGFLKRNAEEKISLTTFRKYIPRNFKKPRRWTDLCKICETGRKKVSQIEKLLRSCNAHSACPSNMNWTVEKFHRDCILGRYVNIKRLI